MTEYWYDFVAALEAGAEVVHVDAFLYHLPYGTVPMEIETQRIVSKLDENGGTIELVYTLMVQGEKYFNDMKITVSKR